MFDIDTRRSPSSRPQPDLYAGHMTVSAHDVARELRARHRGLPVMKLHKLLYYCQGHHLAAFGEPLFRETISAWDMGPVVGTLWKQENAGEMPGPGAELTEAQLNTIGYVLSRYGALTGIDLAHLTHSETPWKRADANRPAGGATRIREEWIKDYFETSGSADEDDEVLPDRVAVRELLRGAEARRAEPLSPDSLEELRARLG
jgi:uncharacterized phage-associated protein